MSIKKFCIKNVRVIKKIELKDNFYPNRPIFIVAPNGYGKTSISKAFQSITQNNMKLKKACFHMNNEKAEPSVRLINSDNKEYVDNHIIDEIKAEQFF